MDTKDKARKRAAANYGLIILAMRVLGYFAVVVVFSTLLSWFSPAPDIPVVHELYDALVFIQSIFTDALKEVFPSIASGKYAAGVSLIIMAVVFKVLLTDSVQLVFKNKLDELELKGYMDEYKRLAVSLGRPSKDFAPLYTKAESLQSGDKESRAELLRLFAETKKKLDSMVRNLAFLSIDVVDSSVMKEGESASLVQLAFDAYKNFVASKLKANGALKSAWTPDGVMICFPTADKAVRAAKDIVKGLAAFNREQKSIKSDFKVRCGVSAGDVQYDEATPMEEMSDYVIDLAGHMQKNGVPNGVLITKKAYEKLWSAKEGFLPAEKVVDGQEVLFWTEK